MDHDPTWRGLTSPAAGGLFIAVSDDRIGLIVSVRGWGIYRISSEYAYHIDGEFLIDGRIVNHYGKNYFRLMRKELP